MEKSTNYYWLDLIRGFAALAVFFGHLRVICFRDYDIQNLPFSGKIIFFLTGFGHEAVIIFFVMSGFFIIKSIHEAHIKGYWSVGNYANNRITRLWVVLIPTLIIGFALDKIGLEYYPDSLAYSNKIRYFTADILEKLNYKILLGNAFFLQTLFVPTLGSNGSLWSLANEFWYYVIFPLFYFSAVKQYKTASRIIMCIAGIFILLLAGKHIMLFFIIWLMGGISYFLMKGKETAIFSSNKLMLFLALVLAFILVAIRFKVMRAYFNDYSLSLIFSILIPFIANQKMNNKYLKNLSNYTSKISYTLYLIHLPFVFFITSCFYFQDKLWGFNNFFIFLVMSSLTLIYATVIWYLFERNTFIFKKYISNFLR